MKRAPTINSRFWSSIFDVETSSSPLSLNTRGKRVLSSPPQSRNLRLGQYASFILFFVIQHSRQDDRDSTVKRYKRGFRLPPADFTYGMKHPQQNGITGVAAGERFNPSLTKSKHSHSIALQHDDELHQRFAQMRMAKSIVVPNFIALNKTVARLGLSKVRDIHQYR